MIPFKRHLELTIQLASTEKDGVSVGFPAIERYMDSGGFQPGQFIVLNAKPKVGKTFFCLNGIHSLMRAKEIRKTLFISLEMSATRITRRLVRMELGMGYNDASNAMREEPQMVFSRFSDFFENFMIYDKKGATLDEISRVIDSFNPEVVWIDYIQLITGEGQDEIAKMSGVAKGLAAMAQEKRIIIFGLSQTAKDSQPGWEMPMSSSGKWSSDIHIAADVIMGMCRPELNPAHGFMDEHIVKVMIQESRDGGSSPSVAYHYDQDSGLMIEYDEHSRQGGSDDPPEFGL